MRGQGLDGVQVAPEAFETWTELTHFSTQGKAVRWGVSGTGRRLVLSLGVRGTVRALLGAPGHPRTASPRRVSRGRARVPAPRAGGAPHPSTPPPGARSQWLLVAGPRLGRQAGTGTIKQAERGRLVLARGRGLPRCPESRRHAPGQASAELLNGSKPRKRCSRNEIHNGFYWRGRLPRGRRPGTASLGSLFPCHRCAHSREPAGVPQQFANRSRRGAGPLGTAEAAADAPLLFFHPVTWGRGEDAAETGPLLTLSPPALQRSASDYIYFARHEAWGPVLVRFLLHLQRQCLLAPCAAQSRSRGRRRCPMQQRRAGAGGARGRGLCAHGGSANRRPRVDVGAGTGRRPGRRAANQRAGPHAAPGSGARGKAARALSSAGWVRFVCSFWRENNERDCRWERAAQTPESVTRTPESSGKNRGELARSGVL